MSDDETPTSDESPDSSADDTTPPEGADATQPDTPAATPAAAATTEERAGVFVPRWVAFLVGALVAVLLVGGAGFALGRATDGDHDDEHGVVEERPFPPPGGDRDDGTRNPPFPIPNPGDGNGGGRGVPGIPGIPGGDVLLGVAVQSSDGDSGGARVAQVVPGSPAQSAGLEQSDVITKVDDTTVSDAQDLVTAIRAHESGDTVTITYERGGQSHTADVTLGGRSSSANGPGSGKSSSSSTS
ncbi:MAG TPA: PDZ domain-containing protein [Acidimicrobiia bacterium]|jgi:membrane-associated protease RseP (regulator of RpoE activity)